MKEHYLNRVVLLSWLSWFTFSWSKSCGLFGDNGVGCRVFEGYNKTRTILPWYTRLNNSYSFVTMHINICALLSKIIKLLDLLVRKKIFIVMLHFITIHSISYHINLQINLVRSTFFFFFLITSSYNNSYHILQSSDI
jgi:hypothetical protein